MNHDNTHVEDEDTTFAQGETAEAPVVVEDKIVSGL